MRRFTIALLGWLCLAGVMFGQTVRGKIPTRAQEQTSESLPDLINLIRPSVVQIVIRTLRPVPPGIKFPCFEGHRTLCIAGTGFFVNADGYVVTAAHVVDGGKTEHPGIKQALEALQHQGISAKVQIGVAAPNIEQNNVTIAATVVYFDAEVVAQDPADDLSVVKSTSVNRLTQMPQTFAGPGAAGWPQTTAQVARLSKTRPTDGEKIFACGYPLSSMALVSTDGKISSAWNSLVLIRAKAEGMSTPVEVYEANLKINPGNSGGPVFRSSDQTVVGVAVEAFGNLTVAVPMKSVKKFLDTNKISWLDGATK